MIRPPDIAEDTTPASAAAIALARDTFQKHGGTCCWFWKDDPPLTTRGAIRELIRSLRDNGNRETWLLARAIERCL
ncbi:MAG: hypothetical protein ABIZ56_13160 [Chthoniobacteraceae bacterium]